MALATNGNAEAAPNGYHQEGSNFDAIVVGAGFSGIYAIYRLRNLGLNVHCFEEGSDIGGTWHWNRYPGARVDSEFPFYQLAIPEVYKTWRFSERFPDHNEIRKYFEHAEKTLHVKRNVSFNQRVTKCTFDGETGRWTVVTDSQLIATAKYLISAAGPLHRKYCLDFPGLKDFRGPVVHSSHWQENLEIEGKRVGIVGSGATGVQLVQELAKKAGKLTVFMRRPSICLPMQQRPLLDWEQDFLNPALGELFATGRKGFSGFVDGFQKRPFLSIPAEEREQILEHNWQLGGFNFALRNFLEVARDKEVNRIVYEFWAKKVRQRMKDPQKQELMAPHKQPYWLGTKRTPLEQDYYECLDMPHVEIVDLKQAPFERFTETGVLTADGRHHDLDLLVLATGFDALTGSATSMGLKSRDGIDVKDLWKDGVRTYLGMMIPGFPNAFMVTIPQSPGTFTNGPTMGEIQINWAVKLIERAESSLPPMKTIEPTKEAAEDWYNVIQKMSEGTLFPLTESWWNGANIPGKKKEVMTYYGGASAYEALCLENLEKLEGLKCVFEDVASSAQTKSA